MELGTRQNTYTGPPSERDEDHIYCNASVRPKKKKESPNTDETNKKRFLILYIFFGFFCLVQFACIIFFLIQVNYEKVELIEMIQKQNDNLGERIQNRTRTLREKIESQKISWDIISRKATIFSQGYEQLSGGWVSLLNGYSYKIISTYHSWHESRGICKHWGSDLAVYGVQSMQSRKLISKAFKFSIMFWIGSKKENNTWYWINGDIVTESSMYWIPNEPNNAGGNENCANILEHKGLLSNDSPCSNQFQALCEKPI